MARGWESKAVESQQADRERREASGPPPAPEDRARAARRQTLELALSRARADLRTATVAAHRAMLDKAIRALEDQLAGL